MKNYVVEVVSVIGMEQNRNAATKTAPTKSSSTDESVLGTEQRTITKHAATKAAPTELFQGGVCVRHGAKLKICRYE